MDYHIAQINIARFRVPSDDPVNADFMNALDRVNAAAEGQPGFVWRLVGEGNNAMDVNAFDDPNMAINMSVWTSIQALEAFVYRHPDHLEIMRRRAEWFEKMNTYVALWWVPMGHEPNLPEAREKLEILAREGPTPAAFTFKNRFPAPP